MWLAVLVVTILGMFLSYSGKKLTLAGSFSGGVIAILVFAGAGISGFLMMAAFFLMAILATSYRKNEKRGSGNFHPVKRNAVQVWANGGMAAVAGALSILMENDEVFPLLIGAVFSAASADTISSEMGMVKGKKFFNILTFKPDKRGLDGVVSIEGIFWGLAASVVIAGIYFLDFESLFQFFIIIIAGTIGNLSDSVLGAFFERKGRMNNDQVNFLNTLVAVIIALLMFQFE